MKRNTSSTLNEVNRLLHDFVNMDSDELYRIYGITINDDKTIYDESLCKTFQNATEWANTTVEEYDSEYDNFHKISNNKTWDDSY